MYRSILLTLVLVLNVDLAAQSRFDGVVTAVPDGRSLEIQTGSRKSIIKLQFVEIPEPGQSLHNEVREHLESMVLGKRVIYIIRAVSESRFTGSVFVNGADLSQQLLRDGAAWYSINEAASHNPAERAAYIANESHAKIEKRGVWGAPNLIPAWEFRAIKSATATSVTASPDQIPDAVSSRETRRPRNGLTQMDLFSSSQRNSGARRISLDFVQPEERKAIGFAIESAETMRQLLKDLSVTGMSLSEYQTRLAVLTDEVRSATAGLPNGKLKILMAENVRLLDDLGLVFSSLRKDEFLYYQKFQKFASRYGISPIQNVKGHYVLTRRDIVNALFERGVQNYTEIIRTLDELSKYVK